MSIVTKTGDKGKTSLYCGKRVCKDNIRIEMCGTLDEASSFLGMAKSLIKDKGFKKIIEAVQKDLFLIGAEVVTGRAAATKIKKRICDREVRFLEENIKALECDGSLKCVDFIIPGKNEASGALDIARALTRRAERRSLALLKMKKIVNKEILVYLNRLSDLLYLLARAHDKKRGVR